MVRKGSIGSTFWKYVGERQRFDYPDRDKVKKKKEGGQASPSSSNEEKFRAPKKMIENSQPNIQTNKQAIPLRNKKKETYAWSSRR